MKSIKNPKIVLVDDDDSFGLIMTRVAEINNVQLDYFSSVSEMGFISALNSYDVAIVDYYLNGMNGLEVAEYIPHFFQNLQMVLISGKPMDAVTAGGYPDCIKEVLNKSSGYEAILRAALTLGGPKHAPEVMVYNQAV